MWDLALPDSQLKQTFSLVMFVGKKKPVINQPVKFLIEEC